MKTINNSNDNTLTSTQPVPGSPCTGLPGIELKYFTDPAILERIGAVRLTRLLGPFSFELHEAKISLPRPEHGNHDSFVDLATALTEIAHFPAHFTRVLASIEAAASPENQTLLDDAIQRRIPNVSVSVDCQLDRALEIWFQAPEELLQFAPEISGPKVPSPGGEGQGEGVLPSQTNPPSTGHGEGVLLSRSNIPVGPWPSTVIGHELLDAIRTLLSRFVVLPKWAAETLALWVVHTYGSELRDVTTYLGIESPDKGCGKTTLITVLTDLANRAMVASNISPSAFFRVIEELRPTLLIDEADTFLQGNDQLRGILNAGYKKKTAIVWRVDNSPNNGKDDFHFVPKLSSASETCNDPQNGKDDVHVAPKNAGLGHLSSGFSNSPAGAGLRQFSSWCPKAISQIGRLPDTLADRCIIIRMHRKLPREACERLRSLDTPDLRRQCARFIQDHAREIANATPEIPPNLSDRAAEIWEPLLAIADLSGGHWPDTARKAASALSANTQENNPIVSLLLDILVAFVVSGEKRLLSRSFISHLTASSDRPWMDLPKAQIINDRWLANQLRPYDVKSRTLRFGEHVGRGYCLEDFEEAFRRYIPKTELERLVQQSTDSPMQISAADAALEPPIAA